MEPQTTMKSHDEIARLLDGDEYKAEPPVIVPPEPPRLLETQPRAIEGEEAVSIPRRHKIIAIAFFVGLIGTIFYFQSYFYYFFIMFLVLAIQCFNTPNEAAVGAIVLGVQILAWLIAYMLIYFCFINMIFPRIRGVNEMRTKNTFARKLILIKGPDPNFVYMKVKFTLFPLFNWYTMKVPRHVKWVRMPSSIDIHSQSINLVWRHNMYVVTTDSLPRLPDSSKVYREKAQSSIKIIGQNMGDSIQGDAQMMKDYYSMNLVMDENKELIPRKNLKQPPSDLERELNDK